jgi:UDP-N-acetylmuramoyl-tripeptide--D-alanyl-D-alanine ligase
VPLTLARMPAETDYGVFEIGMNHAGEIAPLTRLVRPHVAIVTTVGPVHIEFFPSESAIADAKAEIFEGLEPGGIAILNRDNVHYERLRSHALARGANVVCFGRAADADVRLIGTEPALGGGSHVHASIEGVELRYLVGAPGAHFVMNSLAVLAAVRRLGADVHTAAGALAELSAPVGRGERTRFHLPGGTVLLIDESYNANPASLAAALAAMAGVPRSEQPRRIAVIGDMRELGARSAELHRALKDPIEAAEVDLVFACGPFMKELFELLPEAVRGGYAETSDGLRDRLIAAVRPGDVVMIKGSLGTRMGPLVEAMKQHFGA